VTQETKRQGGRVTEATTARAEGRVQSPKIRGAHIREFASLEIAPDLFDGIQLRRVPGEPLHGQPVALSSEVRTHPVTLVRGQAIPDQNDPPPTEVTFELPKKADQGDILVGPRARLEEKARAAAIPSKGQRAGDRQALPVPADVRQDRGLAARGPRTADDGLLRESAFVLEDEPRALAPGVFFSSAQRRVFQASIAASFRSRARRAGRWSDQPSRRRMRQTWPGWYCTPVRRSITAAIRGSVHKSVRNPCAAGPARNACSTAAKASASNRGLRPARPAPLSPGRPRAFQAWYQWWALTRVTPSFWATAACDSPRANSRAACSRRASIAAKSRWGVGMFQHAMVPVKIVSLFNESH
jgi:hypothetical protein